ncbi:MAG: PilZ domain-containing protein [Gammaproteobacteria bacterium]|nr:PilZ domain-containing protein [Gammaproteobacteria bacterium]NIR85534.1 PilZ domain-containing protein [Gammaproteobacteria bacterium]NIR89793.1 PilZ domain-containing protein [Gammaproteobacteria bacterium]NIU06669.1 PilZ domain-containing protein [Gammaproteobacteria bacterium]NIV75060.1 hypothetical protein [Gammaproteobacteria bacterium]
MTEPTTTDRRGYPRVPARFPIRLVGEDGAELSVRTLDIAPRGIKLQCDTTTAYGLSRRVGPIEPDESPELRIEFDLPLASRSVHVATQCRMIYLYILPEDDTATIGMEFVGLPDDAHSALAQFMEEAISPP